MDELDLELIELDYHRNGVSGAGFYVARFYWTHDHKRELFTGTWFPMYTEEGERLQEGYTAILSTEIETIQFGINSWRGDQFEHRIAQWVDALSALQNSYGIKWYDLNFQQQMELLRKQLQEAAT